jgi:K+-transporting ATPase A subunit
MFGRMLGAGRQAWPIFGAMFAMFAIGVAIAVPSEHTAEARSRQYAITEAVATRLRPLR